MALKLRLMTKFPALVQAAVGLAVQRAGRTYTFLMDWLSVGVVEGIPDLTSRYLLVVSGTGTADQLYERIALSTFLSGGGAQVITSGGTQNIAANATLVIVDQTVGAAITLNLPPAATKIGAVKIVDWKGDAGTNNITVVPDGSETFNGGATSWVIGADGGSAVFHPYSTEGYAV